MNIQISDIQEGFVWKSEWMRVSRLQALWFAIATGDWNPVHFNPLTWFLYKSNLGGQTVTGDMLLSLTKKGALEMVEDDETEVIAYGYDHVTFERPLHVGVPFQYVYTLITKESLRGKTIYHWSIELHNNRGKKICHAVWKACYLQVAKSSFGERMFPLIKHREEIALAALALFMITIVSYEMTHPGQSHLPEDSETWSHPGAVAL